MFQPPMRARLRRRRNDRPQDARGSSTLDATG